MASFVKCFTGPRLFLKYREGQNNETKVYQGNFLEQSCDTVIKWMKFGYSLSYWTSPIILTFMYRRGVFTPEGMVKLLTYGLSASILLAIMITLRGIGRLTNSEYMAFVAVLTAAQKAYTPENKAALNAYDFEFFAWPVDFSVTAGKGVSKPAVSSRSRSRGMVHFVRTLPCHILAYIAAHTFGRRMVYPGTTALIQTLMGPMLTQGRSKLVEEKRGIRSKLVAQDKNHIDTMFVDRRGRADYPHGNTLVICCEGNSGFYEVGCMITPLEAGYSVLGWNHPGFWGSSGVPFPDQEQAAIDVVMQYAINKLSFTPDNIILFAWSIGGFSASWAAMNYPDVKHVCLDATFDDIVPLAIARMPESWRSLVILTVKTYLNLNNSWQLCRYPGPVLLIRRTKDEMITTVDPTTISSNRGNDLLLQLLQHRYPKIINGDSLTALREWIQAGTVTRKQELWTKYSVDSDLCRSILRSYIEENSASFPMQLGQDIAAETQIQLALFLASKHMVDYDSTHCTPLPATFFTQPWNIESL